MSLTYDELDAALTDACADRDAYAADLRAAQEEVERLRATVARLEGGHRRICARLGRDVGSDDPHVAAEDAAAALVMEAGGLRAELAEALATLANERGGGDPPEPGWVWDAHLRQWTYYDNVKPRSFAVRVAEDRWVWATWGPKGRRGNEGTARAAMHAATKAVRGES